MTHKLSIDPATAAADLRCLLQGQNYGLRLQEMSVEALQEVGEMVMCLAANVTHRTLVDKVAEAVSCPATHVSLTYRDPGPEGGEVWACEVVSVGKGKTRRPTLAGYGNEPGAAVKDLLGSTSFRRWKDPEGFEKDQERARRREQLDEFLADGTLTQEQYDNLIAKQED